MQSAHGAKIRYLLTNSTHSVWWQPAKHVQKSQKPMLMYYSQPICPHTVCTLVPSSGLLLNSSVCQVQHAFLRLHERQQMLSLISSYDASLHYCKATSPCPTFASLSAMPICSDKTLCLDCDGRSDGGNILPSATLQNGPALNVGYK